MNLKLKQLFIWSAALFFIQLGNAQQLNYSYTNYTLENGLPSNECHKILEDQNGYIWIASDRGLSRFDGYTFKNYGIKNGLKDISCLNILIAPDQKIWIYTASHRIYIYDPKTDQIERFKHDNLLVPYKDLSGSFDLAHIDKNNRVYFQARNYGIVSIDPSGKIELRNQYEPCFFIENIEGKNLISYDLIDSEGKIDQLHKQAYSEHTNCLRYKGMQLPLFVNNNWNGDHALGVFDDFSDNFILASINGVNFFINDHGLLGLKEVPHTIDIAKLNNRQLLSAHLNKGGVRFYNSESNLRSNQFSYLLSDVSATGILVDKQDNIWISTLEDGIFYLKEKDVKMVTDINLSFKKINHLEKDESGNIYMVVDNTKLARYNTRRKTYSLLHDYRYKIFDLNYNPEVGKLLVSAFASSTFNLERGQPVNLYYADQQNTNNSLISSTASDLLDNNQYILSRRNGFSIIDRNLQNQLAEISEVNALGMVHRVSDFKENQLLIASANGIFTYNLIDQKLDTIPQFLGQRFNDVVAYKDTYLLASQGRGVIVWDGAGEQYQLNEKHGLLSDNIENLYIDTQDKLYVCTYQGLSKINLNTLGKDKDTNLELINFSKFQGLPSKDVYDVIDVRGNLYIATGKGLAIMPKDLREDQLHQPLIDQIQVKETLYSPQNSPRTQSYNNNNLSIQYKSLDMKMLGNITYRYRLNENPWVETKATQVDFSSLGAGDYNFDLQSKNITGRWSPSVKYDFVIETPFWQKWCLFHSSFSAPCYYLS